MVVKKTNEFKCLEKYEDYFNSDFTNIIKKENIYESFLNYNQKEIIRNNISKQKLREDLNKFNSVINSVHQKLIELNNSILLVVGQVQSGKTNFIIGLSAKIFSTQNNKINVVINLTTNNINLNKQTQKRFGKFYTSIELNKKIQLYNFSDLKKMLKERKIIKNNCLFFLLKNKIYLEKMNEYLSFLKKFNFNLEVIIIDDEGDNASFNTNLNKNNSENKLSTINKLLKEIIKKNNYQFKINFVSITATPLVHYFSNEENNLKPDFAFMLEPGNGYTGIIEFNKEFNEKGSKVINYIDPDDEISNHKNNSLEKAITCYLSLCCLSEKIYSKNNIKPRMIINMSFKKEQHKILKNEINNWLNNYKKRSNLISTHLKTYNVWNIVPNLYESEKKLIKKLSEIILQDKWEIIILNSNEKNIDFDEDATDKFQIIIGSYKLSRGLTIKNLISAYMSFRPIDSCNIDVLLQRARWFGYHQSYIKHMRIFLTNELIDDYAIAADMMNNFYRVITDAHYNQNNFKKIERFIPISKFKNNVKPVNKRAPTKWKRTTLQTIFMRKEYKNNQDKMMNLLTHFQLEWKKEREKESNYPIIQFNNLNTFIKKWFNSIWDFCFAIGMQKHDFDNFVVENNFLEMPVYVRLINYDIKEIIFKPRLITSKTKNKEYTFYAGNYANDLIIDTNKIKIDLLPLEIWSKSNNDVNINIQAQIFRLRFFLPLKNNFTFKTKSGFGSA